MTYKSKIVDEFIQLGETLGWKPPEFKNDDEKQKTLINLIDWVTYNRFKALGTHISVETEVMAFAKKHGHKPELDIRKYSINKIWSDGVEFIRTKAMFGDVTIEEYR